MSFNLPKSIEFTLKVLNTAGFEAYIVGGCVRDILCGRTPCDYDITTSAKPDEVKALFSHTADTGLRHGTVTVIENGECIEVTTFRTEAVYSDHRKPDHVSFVDDLSLDLARRDFTVNAICYSPKSGITDLFGGCDDIRAKILRTVGNADERFCEDALRIMRLFRFSATLGFRIEEQTRTAAYRNAPLLEGISRERITAELTKAASGSDLGELNAFFDDGGLSFLKITHSAAEGISRLPKKEGLRLFALLYTSSDTPLATASELRLSKSRERYFERLKEALEAPLPQKRPELKRLLRRCGEKTARDLLSLEAALLGKDILPAEALIEEIISKGEPYRIYDLCLDGNDLKALGVEPRKIGSLLFEMLEAVTDTPELNTPDKLLKTFNLK